MSTTTRIELLIIVWVVAGTAVTLYMTRRGYRSTRWAALGFLFGPFALAFVVWARLRAGRVEATVTTAGQRGPGELSVLIGVDGSTEARRAMLETADLLGDRIGLVTLATVVDHESGSRPGSEHHAWAEELLASEAAALTERSGLDPRTVVLGGRPADQLAGFARDEGVDLLVVGRHGQGESEWLLGSVAADLAERSPTRLLIFDAPTPDDGARRPPRVG